jgi:hypothetical protein
MKDELPLGGTTIAAVGQEERASLAYLSMESQMPLESEEKDWVIGRGRQTIRERFFEYASCGEWLQTVRTDATRDGFIFHMAKFCDFHHTIPDQIIALSQEQIKLMVIRYVLHLKK